MKRIEEWLLLLILLIVCAFLVFKGCEVERARAEEIDDLIPFIIKVESSGNPNAVSNKGCIGLMQINPKGALAEWNDEWKRLREMYEGGYPNNSYPYALRQKPIYKHNIVDLFKSDINIKIGEWYLRRLKNHYLKENYTIERMLHAWNGGITRLRKLNYDCSKMPKESREFSKKVLRLYQKGRED